MRVSVRYNYRCPCGYIDTKTDIIDATGSYVRPVINAVSACPHCHRLLPVEITLTYTSTASVVIVDEEKRTDKLKASLTEMTHIAEGEGIYD